MHRSIYFFSHPLSFLFDSDETRIAQLRTRRDTTDTWRRRQMADRQYCARSGARRPGVLSAGARTIGFERLIVGSVRSQQSNVASNP
jgi:hypothetical protein